MAIFEKKPAPKKTAKEKKVDLLTKLRDIADKRALEWMHETFAYSRENPGYSEEGVRRVVDEKLRNAFDTIIYDAVGIDRSYDHWKVRYDSPLKAIVKHIAQEDAVAIVTKLFKTQEKKLPSALPDKVRRAVEKEYEEAYLDRLSSAARELGAQKAEKDVEEVLERVMKEVSLK